MRITSKARDGARAFIALTHSSRTRSATTLRKVSSVGRMAASVAGSSAISSVATKRAARSTRRPSSEKRSSGSPTARRTRRARSPRPPYGSMTLPSTGSMRDRVDGEVAAREIGRDVVDELDPVGAAPVGVRPLAAQRRHLVVLAVLHDGDGAVLDARRDGAREDREQLLGPRVGRDVPVARDAAEQQIAHAPADDPRALALLAQPLAEPEDVRRDRGEVDPFRLHRRLLLPRRPPPAVFFRVRNISPGGRTRCWISPRSTSSRRRRSAAWCAATPRAERRQARGGRAPLPAHARARRGLRRAGHGARAVREDAAQDKDGDIAVRSAESRRAASRP